MHPITSIHIPVRWARRLRAALTSQPLTLDDGYTAALGAGETVEVFTPDGVRALAFTVAVATAVEEFPADGLRVALYKPEVTVTYAGEDPDQGRDARVAVGRWAIAQADAERRAQRAEQEGKG